MSDEKKVALIQHLSTEIATQTNVAITQRTRNNLVFWIGPFVVLGAVSANDTALASLQAMSPQVFWTSVIGVLILYLGMGVAAAGIEHKIWDQCNVWRRQIQTLSEFSQEAEDITFSSRFLYVSYIAIFLIMGLLLAAFLFLLRTTPG